MSEVISATEKVGQQIAGSNYISRDLSWLQFNYRVHDPAKAELAMVIVSATDSSVVLVSVFIDSFKLQIAVHAAITRPISNAF